MQRARQGGLRTARQHCDRRCRGRRLGGACGTATANWLAAQAAGAAVAGSMPGWVAFKQCSEALLSSGRHGRRAGAPSSAAAAAGGQPPTFLPPLEASSACFTPVEVQPACGAAGAGGSVGEAGPLRLRWVWAGLQRPDVLPSAPATQCTGAAPARGHCGERRERPGAGPGRGRTRCTTWLWISAAGCTGAVCKGDGCSVTTCCGCCAEMQRPSCSHAALPATMPH